MKDSSTAKTAKSSSTSSTLSLHITAYENSVEVNGDDSIDGMKSKQMKKEKSKQVQKWKNAKQILTSSTSAIQAAYEFPRQQHDQITDPEVAQFKASQRLLKISSTSYASSQDFTCKKCPVDHGVRPCPRATSKPTFTFDFSKLHPLLQRRFIDIATVYEKSKLQKVTKSFNALIKPEKYTIIRELIAHANSHYSLDHSFWNIGSYKTHVHPEQEAHLEKLKDLIINKKFNGVLLPENWIGRCLTQNVNFYLTKLHIRDSKLTHTELKALCDFGALDSLFLDNITCEPPPKAAEIAMWTTNICRFHVNIKNFECEANWIKYFTQFSDKRMIRMFEFKNLSTYFNANDFDKFVRTRMISSKEKQANQPEVAVRISFADHFIKNLKKKSFQSKLDRMFKGVFLRVPKVQYESFSSTDRFIVEGKREEKSSRTYFFVNCRAVDALLKDAEEQKIAKRLGLNLLNLRV